MIIFTIMMLLLTLGGVTALLRRSVFLPIRRLQHFAEVSAKGMDSNITPPSHLPDDLGKIASSIRSLARNANGVGQKQDNT